MEEQDIKEIEQLENDMKPKLGRPRKTEAKPKKTMYNEIENEKKDIINNKLCDELFDLNLTEKEQSFVLYYLERNNAAQAYLLAYADAKSTKQYASVNGAIVLRRPHIRTAIKRLKKIMQIGFDVDPTKYLETQLKIASADIGDYIKFSEEEIPLYNEDGTIMFDPDTGEQKFKKVNRMHLVNSDTVDTSVITSIKQGKDGITIQLMDKMKAWENIKNFFEWKANKKAEEANNTNIIDALSEGAKSSWNSEDIDKDLKETLKEDI